MAAVLSGYQRHHQLSAAEVEYLPHAVRVRPAVIAARTFRDAVEQGVPPDATGWWARYAEADTVAACARRLLEPGSGVRRRAMGA